MQTLLLVGMSTGPTEMIPTLVRKHTAVHLPWFPVLAQLLLQSVKSVHELVTSASRMRKVLKVYQGIQNPRMDSVFSSSSLVAIVDHSSIVFFSSLTTHTHVLSFIILLSIFPLSIIPPTMLHVADRHSFGVFTRYLLYITGFSGAIISPTLFLYLVNGSFCWKGKYIVLD